MKFILILFIMHGSGNGAAMQEFNTKKACELALIKITRYNNSLQNRTGRHKPNKYFHAPDTHGICVKKGVL